MKNIFISILVLASPMLIHAQPYKQCLDGEFIRWGHTDSRITDVLYTSTDIVAYGDTLLNDIMYKRLYDDHSFNSEWNADSTNTSWKNHIPDTSSSYAFFLLKDLYIRESEDFSKLYLYNAQFDEEYLISDMDLQVGDSFLIVASWNVYNNNDFYTIKAIADSIYFDDDLKHVSLNYGTLTFVEGVGTDQWFIYPISQGGSYIGVNCFQNQSFFYKNNRIVKDWNFANIWCGTWKIGQGLKPIIEPNYHVFVQPGSMDIIFDSETNADISIYDMQGRLCYTKDNVFGKKIIVPTAELSKGLYLLRVVNRNNNNQTSTIKFIPQ